MYIKISRGKGGRGLLEYVLNSKDGEKGHERGEIIGGTTAGRNARDIAAEFGLFRRLRPTVNKAIVHFSLNLPPTEREIDNQTFAAIGHRVMQEMGYETCPYVCIRHRDRDHQHLHIAGVKIDAEGQTVPESGERLRAAKVARQIEAEFNLIPLKQETPMTPEQQKAVEQRLEESSTEAKRKLEDLIPGVACADADLDDAKRRDFKRKLLEEHYHATVGQLLLADLQYIKRTPIGLIISIRPQGRIVDSGDRVTAERMNNQEAARLVVEFAALKAWEKVYFFGNDEFLRAAMEEALNHDLNVEARDEHQAKILAEVIEARRGVTRKPEDDVKKDQGDAANDQAGPDFVKQIPTFWNAELGQRIKKHKDQREKEGQQSSTSTKGPAYRPRMR